MPVLFSKDTLNISASLYKIKTFLSLLLIIPTATGLHARKGEDSWGLPVSRVPQCPERGQCAACEPSLPLLLHGSLRLCISSLGFAPRLSSVPPASVKYFFPSVQSH